MPTNWEYECGGCGSDHNQGARWVKKCTWCCKRYCNQCISGGCPHCGKSGEDWTHKVLTDAEYKKETQI